MTPFSSGIPKNRFLIVLELILFTAAVVFIGDIVAKKIFNIPTRLDVVVFIAILVFIPVMKFPISGIFFLVIVPPFIGFIRRVFYLFYDRPSSDLLIIIPDLMIVMLFIVLFDRIRKGEHIKSEDDTVVKWIWIFFFYQLARVFIANGSGVVTGINQFKFVALYILCFFYAIHFIKTKKQVISIFKVTSVIGFIVALYGIKQAFFGYTRFEEIWIQKMHSLFVTLFIEGKPRPFSTLPSPASFADYMVIAIYASLSLLSMKSTKGKAIYALFIPPMIVALLITSVRSNWIGFIMGVLFWFIIAHRSSIRYKILFVAFLLLVFFVGSTFLDSSGARDLAVMEQARVAHGKNQDRKITEIFVTDRTSALTNPFQEHSMISRTGMWRQAIQSSMELPMGPFGWGMGSFNTHSYYFSTLYDIGYPGFFLLLFLLYRIFRAGYIVYREEEEPDRRVIARFILSIMFAITVMNSTGTHISEHPADIYYWFGAGILLVLRRLKSGDDDISEKTADAIIDPT